MKIPALKLFLLFVKIGTIALGGGYVILPLLKTEFTEKRNWLTPDELIDYFTIAQTLPGIVAANVSMFVGYKLKGIFGAVLAIAGVTFVPFWTIVAIASILDKILTNTCVQGMFWGIGLGIIALIFLTAGEIWKNSKRDIFFDVMLLASLVSILCFNFSPVKTILTFVPIGIVYHLIFKKGLAE